MFEKVFGGSVDTSAEPVAHGKTGGNNSTSETSDNQDGSGEGSGDDKNSGEGQQGGSEANAQPKKPDDDNGSM